MGTGISAVVNRVRSKPERERVFIERVFIDTFHLGEETDP